MSEIARPSVEVTCADCGQSLGDQFAPGDGYHLALAHWSACPNRPVTFDSMGSPIFRHQLPPEETSDER